MHHLRNVLAVLVLGVAVVTLTPAATSAAEPPQPDNSLARVNVGPTSVDWLPAVDYERLVLTIVGPEGFESRQELEKDQNPSLTLFTSNGERLPDGVYRYELRLLSKGKPREDSVQRGGFLVRDGGFVKPRLTAERTTSPPVSSTKAQIHNITGKDSVVADDLVVQGTACIGPSCVNGDPNSNTLTLKGITPRIFFHDLNADCNCYPARNWLLQANLNYPAYPLDSFFLQDLLSGATPFSVQGGAQDDTLVVSLDGKVGIGTEAPLKSLHIVRAAAPTVRLEQPVSPGPARTWDVGADNTQFFVSDVTASTQPLRIRAGAPTSSIDVAASGNVGIGTANPGAKLHLFDNTDVFTVSTIENSSAGVNAVASLHAVSNSATAFLQAQGSGRTISHFGQTVASWAELLQVTGNGLLIGTLIDKPLILGTNNVNRVQVTASGDVGIGTTAPSSKLHVNGGDIRVSGGSFIDDGVTLNAPDYVFEPDYSLMPIEKLRDFVTREKRLPNVPSAREIKGNGLNLSQFQMRLLEKVEELTLYTLTQDERIKAQQEQIAGLLERLAALEKNLPKSSEQAP